MSSIAGCAGSGDASAPSAVHGYFSRANPRSWPTQGRRPARRRNGAGEQQDGRDRQRVRSGATAHIHASLLVVGTFRAALRSAFEPEGLHLLCRLLRSISSICAACDTLPPVASSAASMQRRSKIAASGHEPARGRASPSSTSRAAWRSRPSRVVATGARPSADRQASERTAFRRSPRLGEDREPLDHVAQLAHVAAPGHRRERRGRAAS